MLFLNVNGDLGRQVELGNLRTNQYIYDPFFDFLCVQYRINTKGNSFYKPQGEIELAQNNQSIGSMTLNPDKKIVLPNSPRNLEVVSKPIFAFKLLSNGGSSHDKWINIPDSGLRRPWFGGVKLITKAAYSDSDGNIQTVESGVQVWFLPWKTGLILVLIGLVFAGLFKFSKGSDKDNI